MQELEVQLQESHNSEAEFTREWLSLLEKKGYRSTKITDWSIWLKPFDWIIESDQDSYFFEAKRILWNIFKNSQMRQNQITSFLRITKLRKNRKCIVVIFKKWTKDYIIIPFVDLFKWWEKQSFIIDFENKIYKSQ